MVELLNVHEDKALSGWGSQPSIVYTKIKNELEQGGTTWNYLEPPETTYNMLELSRTTYNKMDLAMNRHRKTRNLYEETVLEIPLPNKMQH